MHKNDTYSSVILKSFNILLIQFILELNDLFPNLLLCKEKTKCNWNVYNSFQNKLW
jgi:hypothetical protein